MNAVTSSKVSFSGFAHTVASRSVSGVTVTIERDSIGLRMSASVTVKVRGFFEYRITAHSRKLDLMDVWTHIMAYKISAVKDEDTFFTHLSNDKLDYMTTVVGSPSGATLVVINLDCEA